MGTTTTRLGGMESSRERKMGKTAETNRRERDDAKRGYWELTEPLTTDEEYELRSLNDFGRWEEFLNDGKTEWRLKDPNDQQRYDELSNKDQSYKASVHFATTTVGLV